jgi:hypothetical protein
MHPIVIKPSQIFRHESVETYAVDVSVADQGKLVLCFSGILPLNDETPQQMRIEPIAT